jgi:hypothetical protein
VVEQRAAGDDALVLLGVVAGRDVVTQLDRAQIGVEAAGDDLEQLVLPAPLRPMMRSRSPRSTAMPTSRNTSRSP